MRIEIESCGKLVSLEGDGFRVKLSIQEAGLEPTSVSLDEHAQRQLINALGMFD